MINWFCRVNLTIDIYELVTTLQQCICIAVQQKLFSFGSISLPVIVMYNKFPYAGVNTAVNVHLMVRNPRCILMAQVVFRRTIDQS